MHASSGAGPQQSGHQLGYKLVGDNIDKGVKTRYMRKEHYHDQSLHYFHSFAVLNRIDHSDFPDVHPLTCLDHPKRRAVTLLPSAQDDTALRANIGILVSRVLTDHMPFFNLTFQDVVDWHIKHQYYSEMSTKSVVVSTCSYTKGCSLSHIIVHDIMQVPLGVLLKNENKGDEMVEIMSHLHQYVPSYEYAKKTYQTCTGELQVSLDHLVKIFFGGDQLTAARARGSKRARVNSLSKVTRLEGIVPCAEDWHVS